MEVSDLVTKISQNCNNVQRKAFSKGSLITTYIEKRKQICILISGKADLIRYDLNGNKDIIDKFTKNDIFGEAFYPVNNNNELFVYATDNTEVLFFLYDDIKDTSKGTAKSRNEFISDLLDLMFYNTIHQNIRIEILSKRTIREKLLSYFTILSSKNFSKVITIPFSITNLANYLSVDRSAMTREIKCLIDEGFIVKEGKNKIRLLY